MITCASFMSELVKAESIYAPRLKPASNTPTAHPDSGLIQTLTGHENLIQPDAYLKCPG